MSHQKNQLTAVHIEALNRPRRIINQEDTNEPVQALGKDINKWLEHRFDLMACKRRSKSVVCAVSE